MARYQIYGKAVCAFFQGSGFMGKSAAVGGISELANHKSNQNHGPISGRYTPGA